MAQKTIGKAYVQILPTTTGIEGKMQSLLKPGAAKAGASAGESAGVDFAKKLIGTVAKLGVAQKITGFVRDAVSAGGRMQQAIGGIQTLFGDQAEKMVENANNAWKTAGISANEYMENVTSFSASLLQSLNGDTKEAATVSDRIMRDMADNANKFGTDMGSIQHAYQGFSKQNYTMLDNLKLGYGGTKTEAQRLVDEMSKMTDIQEELGITVKEGDLSFGNLANAISVAQRRMGVMGTTAVEADGTLTGSFNSMSAAFENLKAQIALGGEEVGPALDALVKAATVSLKNMIPMVTNVLSALPGIISNLIMDFGQQAVISIRANKFQWIAGVREFVESIGEFIEGDGLSDIVGIIMTVITEISTFIGNALPTLIPALVNLVIYIGQTLIENAPTLIQAALSLFEGFANGILAALPIIVEKIPTIVQALVNFFVWNAPQLLATGVELIVALSKGLIQAVPQMVTAVVSTLKANWPLLKAAGRNMLNTIKEGLLSVLSSLGSVGMDIVRGIWNGISGGLDWIKNMIRGWVGNIKDFLKQLFGIASPSKWAAEEVGRWIPAGIAVGIEANTASVDKAMESLRTDMDYSFKPDYASMPGYTANSNAGGAGGVNVTIYGADHQDEMAIARYVERVLVGEIKRKELAYA